MLDSAKVKQNYQITIPVPIRKKLNLREGDRVTFVEEDGKMVVKNSALTALEEVQKAFEGEAERVGWKSEEDVIAYCREIRREMGKKYGYID
ncbi:MAG: AbrB/MazE/SpoVT family DNA-binding domain-containing protein [Ruminococcus sp.]|jgi:AbrB family looped-hinge helix DNA binding protein|nr:AbrB/MazE/SpoVT family DNA-binding domain-containing protein [Ruminococcus sp.]